MILAKKLQTFKSWLLAKVEQIKQKLKQLFDMDRIQLAAAALSKQTDEDKVRIRLKQEPLKWTGMMP